MRASTIACVLTFVATSVNAQYLNQSAPFALVIRTTNETYNGSTLVPCHEGAAIEGLCLGPPLTYPIASSVPTYTLSYSADATVDPAIGTVGNLIYELVAGDFNISSPLLLSYSPNSNVAVPLFTPSETGTQIAFKDDNLLGIPGYIDDRLTAPNEYSPQTYYRFNVCQTYAGYLYTTLAWVMGDTVPQNPTCVQVDVLREFA